MDDTPSQTIIKAAQQPVDVADSNGRAITIRKIGTLERMRLFEVVGPENVNNQAYFGYAILAAYVSAIAGVPKPRITTKTQLEAMVQELGDEGLVAVSEGVKGNFMPVEQTEDEAKDALKNA